MSIQNLFELSRRAFIMLNSSMNVVGQNIANAETPGYTRRRVQLQTDSLSINGIHLASIDPRARGLGASVQSIDRMRDQLIFQSQLRAESQLASSDTRHRVLSALESLFPAEGGQSLDGQLTAFWNAWNDVANHPEDVTSRSALVEKTRQLTDTIRSTASGLLRLQEAQTRELGSMVREANETLKKIADLNQQIARARNMGVPDLEAEDARDRLLRSLNELLPVEATTDEAGNFRIAVRGAILLENQTVQELSFDVGTRTLQVGDIALTLGEDDGRIGGTHAFINQTIPDIQRDLDTLVAHLVSQVNTLHRAGYGLDGVSGRDFFDPAGTTASTFALASDILEDPSLIAAASEQAAGDNTIARAIVSLQSTPIETLDNRSITEFAINITANVGAQVERASSTLEARQFAVDYLSALEKSLSGVSLDEEMTLMIQYQQQFAASAKVLQTARDMMDTLLNL